MPVPVAVELAQSCPNLSQLVAAYQSVINTLHVSHIGEPGPALRRVGQRPAVLLGDQPQSLDFTKIFMKC